MPTACLTEQIAASLVVATAEGLGRRRAARRAGVGYTTTGVWIAVGRRALAEGRDTPESRLLVAMERARVVAAVSRAREAVAGQPA